MDKKTLLEKLGGILNVPTKEQLRDLEYSIIVEKDEDRATTTGLGADKKPKRTPQEQLSHLDAGGHRAEKEREKLNKQIETEKQPKQETKQAVNPAAKPAVKLAAAAPAGSDKPLTPADKQKEEQAKRGYVSVGRFWKKQGTEKNPDSPSFTFDSKTMKMEPTAQEAPTEKPAAENVPAKPEVEKPVVDANKKPEVDKEGLPAKEEAPSTGEEGGDLEQPLSKQPDNKNIKQAQPQVASAANMELAPDAINTINTTINNALQMGGGQLRRLDPKTLATDISRSIQSKGTFDLPAGDEAKEFGELFPSWKSVSKGGNTSFIPPENLIDAQASTKKDPMEKKDVPYSVDTPSNIEVPHELAKEIQPHAVKSDKDYFDEMEAGNATVDIAKRDKIIQAFKDNPEQKLAAAIGDDAVGQKEISDILDRKGIWAEVPESVQDFLKKNIDVAANKMATAQSIKITANEVEVRKEEELKKQEADAKRLENLPGAQEEMGDETAVDDTEVKDDADLTDETGEDTTEETPETATTDDESPDETPGTEAQTPPVDTDNVDAQPEVEEEDVGEVWKEENEDVYRKYMAIEMRPIRDVILKVRNFCRKLVGLDPIEIDTSDQDEWTKARVQKLDKRMEDAKERAELHRDELGELDKISKMTPEQKRDVVQEITDSLNKEMNAVNLAGERNGSETSNALKKQLALYSLSDGEINDKKEHAQSRLSDIEKQWDDSRKEAAAYGDENDRATLAADTFHSEKDMAARSEKNVDAARDYIGDRSSKLSDKMESEQEKVAAHKETISDIDEIIGMDPDEKESMVNRLNRQIQQYEKGSDSYNTLANKIALYSADDDDLNNKKAEAQANLELSTKAYSDMEQEMSQYGEQSSGSSRNKRSRDRSFDDGANEFKTNGNPKVGQALLQAKKEGLQGFSNDKTGTHYFKDKEGKWILIDKEGNRKDLPEKNWAELEKHMAKKQSDDERYGSDDEVAAASSEVAPESTDQESDVDAEQSTEVPDVEDVEPTPAKPAAPTATAAPAAAEDEDDAMFRSKGEDARAEVVKKMKAKGQTGFYTDRLDLYLAKNAKGGWDAVMKDGTVKPIDKESVKVAEMLKQQKEEAKKGPAPAPLPPSTQKTNPVEQPESGDETAQPESGIENAQPESGGQEQSPEVAPKAEVPEPKAITDPVRSERATVAADKLDAQMRSSGEEKRAEVMKHYRELQYPIINDAKKGRIFVFLKDKSNWVEIAKEGSVKTLDDKNQKTLGEYWGKITNGE
jgi:hypothetical protein